MAAAPDPDPEREHATGTELPHAIVVQRILEWEQRSTSVSILVTGKTGAGKSTLVDKLVGSPVSESDVIDDSLDAGTLTVVEYAKVFEELGVSLTIWDSPGLQGDPKSEKQYLKGIRKKCKNADLFIFCIRMSERRFLPGSDNTNLNAMKKLTEQFGKKLWKNAIIVLTFANDIAMEVSTAFDEKLTDWRKTIADLLKSEVRLPQHIVKDIKIIPAGFDPHTVLPYAEVGYSWLVHLWLQAVLAMKSNAKPAMLKINQHRFSASSHHSESRPEAHAGVLEDVSAQKDLVFEEKAMEFKKKYQVQIYLALMFENMKKTSKLYMELLIALFVSDQDSEFENDLHASE